MTQSLRRFLLTKYGGSSNRQITNPNTNGPISVDDVRSIDAPSEFCWIYVAFPQPEGETFELCLSQAPCDDRVKDWATKRKAKLTPQLPFQDRVHITVHLGADDVTSIKSLAGRINTIPSRQAKSTRTNPHRNYPWLCRRIAASLKRFAAFLDEYQVMKALPPAPEKLEGLFAILDEMPKSPAHKVMPDACVPRQQRANDKVEKPGPNPNACPQSRPSPDQQDNLFKILADLDKETTPINRVVG